MREIGVVGFDRNSLSGTISLVRQISQVVRPHSPPPLYSLHNHTNKDTPNPRQGPQEGPPEGPQEGPPEGAPEGSLEGPPEGAPEGSPQGRRFGGPLGGPNGVVEVGGPPGGPLRGRSGGSWAGEEEVRVQWREGTQLKEEGAPVFLGFPEGRRARDGRAKAPKLGLFQIAKKVSRNT